MQFNKVENESQINKTPQNEFIYRTRQFKAFLVIQQCKNTYPLQRYILLIGHYVAIQVGENA